LLQNLCQHDTMKNQEVFMRNLSKQFERVGRRKNVAYRPDSSTYEKLMEQSKKYKISLNQVIDKIIKRSKLLA
jgi:hypothetical protein